MPEGDIILKEVREEINEDSIKRLVDQNDNHLVSSKLGGWCPSEDVEQDAFLGAMHDGDYFSPFNWEKQYLISSEVISIDSYRMWDIGLVFGNFSLCAPAEYDMEEAMSKIFLVQWALPFKDNEKEKNCYIHSDIYQNFHIWFDYPQERCAWLSKSEFLNELRDIYNCSYNHFQRYKAEANNNPKRIASLEPQYPRFQHYLRFFEDNIHNEEIIRLNTFNLDEYMWYFVKADSLVYSIQISDFS